MVAGVWTWDWREEVGCITNEAHTKKNRVDHRDGERRHRRRPNGGAFFRKLHGRPIRAVGGRFSPTSLFIARLPQ